MPSGVLTPARRDALRLLVALILLAGPLWVPALHLDDRTYQYERAEVVYDGEEGLRYADTHPSTAISEDIACAGAYERACAFERYVEAGNAVSSGYSLNALRSGFLDFLEYNERYRYVEINGSVYDPVVTFNESDRLDGGRYDTELGLEPVDTEQALDSVSLNATRDSDEVSSVVFEAAKKGSARSPEKIELPNQPVKLANGSYYRVYWADSTDPKPVPEFLGNVLPYVTPLVGVWMLYRLRSRFEVSHVSESERR